MKKWLVFMLLPLLLAGCGTEETFETVSDDWEIPAMAPEREISVELPGEATVCAVQSDSGRLYLCNGYEISIETMESGDLNGTIQAISGYDRDELTVMTTQDGEIKRHEFVWSSAGENGDRLGRSVILDDGNYHYVMTVLRDADQEDSQIIWSRVFRSFSLV